MWMISCLDEIYLPLTSYLMIEGGRQAQWTEGWGWGVGVITNCMLYYHGQWTFFLPERKYIVMVNNVFYSEGCNCRIQANMRTKRLQPTGKHEVVFVEGWLLYAGSRSCSGLLKLSGGVCCITWFYTLDCMHLFLP